MEIKKCKCGKEEIYSIGLGKYICLDCLFSNNENIQPKKMSKEERKLIVDNLF